MTNDFTGDAKRNLDRFVAQLGLYVPDPTIKRLMDPSADYTPDQLRSLLQEYGAYVSNLAATRRKMEAEHLLMDKSYKLTKQILMGHQTVTSTLAAAEAALMASPEGAPLVIMQLDLIKSESCQIIVKGWLEAYESAYAAVSRVVSVMLGEAETTGGNQRFN